jgi:hypothetical protein
MLRTKARSIGRRFLARNSGSRAPFHQASPVRRGVEGEAPDALRVPLGERRGAESARGNAVGQIGAHAAGARDVVRRDREVVGAGRDVAVDVAMLVGPPVALHVNAPGVVAEPREVVHRRRFGPSRDLQVEGRLRTHRRAVDEEDRPPRLHRGDGSLLPEEQTDRTLVGPVLTSENGGLGGHRRLLSSGARLGRRGVAHPWNTVHACGSKATRRAWPTYSGAAGSAWARTRVPSSSTMWQSMVAEDVRSATFPRRTPRAASATSVRR